MLSLEELKNKYSEEQLYRVPMTIEGEDFNEVKLEFVFKKPKAGHVDRLLKEISTKPSLAMKNYLLTLVVAEHREALEKAMEEYPMIHTQLTDKLNGLAGGNAVADLKKL